MMYVKNYGTDSSTQEVDTVCAHVGGGGDTYSASADRGASHSPRLSSLSSSPSFPS